MTAPGRGTVPRVLTIAGTDPTGGAGLQADLKSIAAHGGYGMGVVTALVAQNTQGVRGVHTPPVGFLTTQLDAVSDDVTIDAVKIGMLGSVTAAAEVAAWIARVRPPVIVLDPVMVATSGDRLLEPDAEDAVRELLAHVDVVTPNRPELAVLLGEPVAATWEEALDQGRRLSVRSGVTVLVKGGHFPGDIVRDALVDATGVVDVVEGPRVRTRCTHGTGCSLSAALATLHAHHGAWVPALAEARAWLTESLEAADLLDVGRGNGPVSHLASLWRTAAPRTTAARVAAEWWDEIAVVRAETDALPFVSALADGSLHEDAFSWYLAQDALYLRDYARVLAHASALAPTPDEQAFWASSAHGAIAAEVELHASWLGDGQLFDARPAPTTIAYVDHLLGLAARGDYGPLVAGLLPCFWMYVDLGERLLAGLGPSHPYARWIETYGDPAFRASTDRAIEIVTTLAASAGPAERAAMLEAFRRSAQHERDFFAAPVLARPAPERVRV